MSQRHKTTIQKQFTETVDAYSKFAVKDTPEVMEGKAIFAAPQPSDLALDVACGPGTMTLALASHVRLAVGVDLTRAMLARAREFQRERQIESAAFTEGEAERLPFPDRIFDLASCQSAFHHMLKPELTLREMARVTKPGGRLLVIDTLGPEEEETWRLYHQIEKARDPSHAGSLRLTTFMELFESLRLQVARQSIKPRERSFDQWMLRAGVTPADLRYKQTRKLMEASALGNHAGHSPRPEGDDLVIVHHEALFLLKS